MTEMSHYYAAWIASLQTQAATWSMLVVISAIIVAPWILSTRMKQPLQIQFRAFHLGWMAVLFAVMVYMIGSKL